MKRMMKLSLTMKIVLGVSVVCAIAVVAFIASISIIPELRQRLPINSKANEFWMVSNGGGVGGLLITLEHSDGSKHVLDIKNGVHTGEPQKYKLPKLPDGTITVRVTVYSSAYLSCDMDVMVFNSASELRRNGLLIYLIDGHSLWVVSGERKICYSNDPFIGAWTQWDNPPEMTRKAYGIGATGVHPSGWKENKWQYYESGS